MSTREKQTTNDMDVKEGKEGDDQGKNRPKQGIRWGGTGGEFMLTGQQRNHEQQSKTVCLYHFSKAHAFIRYTKERQTKMQKSAEENTAAAVGAPKESALSMPSLSPRGPRSPRGGGDLDKMDLTLMMTSQDDQDCLEEIKKPLSTSDTRIVQLQKEFLDNLPLEKLSIYDENQKRDALNAAHRYLTSSQLCQLVSLLCHLLYWTLFSQFTDHTLPHDAMEKIVLSMQKFYVKFNERLRRYKHYSLFHLPIFLDSICFTCQNVFRHYYPKWFESRFGKMTDEGIIAIVDKVFNCTNYLSNSTQGQSETAVIPPFCYPKHAEPIQQKDTNAMRAVHNPRLQDKVNNLKLRELFSATSPLVSCIFPSTHAMSLPAAKQSMRPQRAGRKKKTRVVAENPYEQRERVPRVVQDFNTEPVLTAPSRRQLFQLALNRVESRHLSASTRRHRARTTRTNRTTTKHQMGGSTRAKTANRMASTGTAVIGS